MIKNELISPNLIIGTTILRNGNVRTSVGLTCKLVKLVSVSLICSSLYICTSSAAVEQVQKAKEKIVAHVDKAKQKITAHAHRDVYLKSGAHVHEDVYLKTKPYIRNTYVKLGAGAMFYEKFKHTYSGYIKKAPKTTPAYNIGIGYRINDSVRTDLNFQYAEVRYKADYLRQAIKTKAAFVNGYYDINSYKMAVPYLTAGLGIGSNNAGYLKTDGEALCKGRNKTNFVWNIGAGAMFKANNNFALDIGYKYMNLGHTKTNDGKSAYDRAGKQTIRSHQVLGSLIYSF
jgi:opacity protein-like surface antigen